MNSITKLHQLNQSLWYDNIERRLLKNGEIARLIHTGEIRGITSNPSIFQNAISKSSDYDGDLQTMAWADWSAEKIFFQLAIKDIQDTADLFTSLYKESDGNDGFVSLEVNPKLAYDAEETYQQALSLWKKVNRPNLMIKIPATKEGLVAIRKSIAAGLNINITLIFSVQRYAEVIEAYLSGLEDRLKKNQEIKNINSVASFFVSRVDSKIDQWIDDLVMNGKINLEVAEKLKGKAAVANSKVAYHLYEEMFSNDRAKKILQKGGKAQRPLWASTSTKNPKYSDVMYVDDLIAANTVNTVPPKTLEAFRDHGHAEITIYQGLKEAELLLKSLANYGIDLNEATQQLEDEGVMAFANSFTSLLETIANRKKQFQLNIQALVNPLIKQISKLDDISFGKRIFAKDASLWTNKEVEQVEIHQRLGWLEAPSIAYRYIPQLEKFRDEIFKDGFTNVILLGMGGSSLASEVLSLSFAGITDGCSLSILDSTDPRQILESAKKVNLGKTLFLVSSKSGGTTEVQAALAYFYQQMKEKHGDNAGDYFVAITDPGTSLMKQAKELNFRKVFEADPNVGGRYSALTLFGLVPAALLGIELTTFVNRAIDFSKNCQADQPAGCNPGFALGALLATAALKGMDKLTIIAEEPFRSFGSWLEQLIAESSGKDGKGIIPVDIEPMLSADSYSSNRIFIYYRNDGVFQQHVDQLVQNGHALVIFEMKDPYNLGAEFYRWEMATAVACSILGVDAFNQPNVQDSKLRTKEKISEFKKSGQYKTDVPKKVSNEAIILASDSVEFDANDSLKEILDSVINSAKSGSYIAINAYMIRNNDTLSKLQKLRAYILSQTHCATTLGFGPRFLHSTGQLHKGGSGNAIFIQITDSISETVEIPGFDITFSDLLYSQALGDYDALKAQGRDVIWFQLKASSIDNLYT